MGRLVVAISLVAILAGCAQSVASLQPVTAEASHRGTGLERPLTPVAERPRLTRGPSTPFVLVSDEPPSAEPQRPVVPDAPASGEPAPLEPAPPSIADPLPEPMDVIAPPCAYPPQRLSLDPCTDPCADPCCWNPCEKGYVGLVPTVLPGLGAGIEFGVHVHRTTSALWSFEMGMQYQDLWKEFTNEPGDGQFAMARIGARVRLNPGRCGHPTFRFGFTWFEAEGTPIELDVAQIEYRGDYLGAYVGIGYEWDLGKRWSMGPEFCLVVADLVNKRPDRLSTGKPFEGREEIAIVPMFLWHINYRL